MNLSDVTAALENLRSKWPDQWPGMAVVIRAALSKLGYIEGLPLSSREQAIHDCMFDVIEAIEQDGTTRHAADQEPRYHNRLHFSDASIGLTALLLNQRKASGEKLDAPPSLPEWLAMLSIVSHDFLHPGTINQHPAELEMRSAEALTPFMQKHGMFAEDQALVRELILKTDPVVVAKCHEAIQGLEFKLSDPRCLTVLIQESDILASSLPGIGQDLTHQLAAEWMPVAPDRAKSLLSDKSRLFFLRHVALFSSPSSRLLGIQSQIDQEIQRLEPCEPQGQ